MPLPAFLTGFNPDGSPYEAKSPYALYASHIGSYMRRYILTTPWGSIRLHRILEADPVRDYPDHPFDFTSFILRGGYAEDLLLCGEEGSPTAHCGEREWWGAWAVLRRKAEQAHRIVAVAPGTLTLCIAGPRRRSWGFHTPTGWVAWRDY